MEKKRTRKRRKSSRTKISNKFLPTLIVITIIGFVVIVIVAMASNKPEEVIEEKLNTLSVFDNEKTPQSIYLYSDNNGQNKLILNTKLKKQNKNKKVYELKVYTEDENLKNKIIEDLEIVSDKGQIKVGQTVIYKKNVDNNEIFMTKYKKAKEEKLEVFVENQTQTEAVINLKYIDKNNNQILEKIYVEKNRGIYRIDKQNLNDEKDSQKIKLDTVYYKLPEGVKWVDLLEDYMAE